MGPAFYGENSGIFNAHVKMKAHIITVDADFDIWAFQSFLGNIENLRSVGNYY